LIARPGRFATWRCAIIGFLRASSQAVDQLSQGTTPINEMFLHRLYSGTDETEMKIIASCARNPQAQ
jgi:hypothetical protein